MNIITYIHGIKIALHCAELKLQSGKMESIEKNMLFAFQEISRREKVCGETLKTKPIGSVMRILMGKYFDLHVKINFHNAWELVSTYQTYIDKGQYNKSLEIYVAIIDVLTEIQTIYQTARKINMEDLKIVNFQPFINIPVQLNFFYSYLQEAHSRILKTVELSNKVLSLANNRYSQFHQPLSNNAIDDMIPYSSLVEDVALKGISS